MPPKTDAQRKPSRKMAQTTVRARILEIYARGEILVETQSSRPTRTLCDFLQTSNGPGIQLRSGDEVIVLLSEGVDQKGCVLGKVGPYSAPDPYRTVIAASKELVLTCGDGSIIMRADGKVLTKGVDIVSHAKRRNRIRGGSVEIN